jgi:uncharacterized membrane protein YhaH (DUF805 family)
MFCKYCGKEIPSSSKFCRYCGNKISSSSKTDEIEEMHPQGGKQEKTNIISNYFNVIKKYVDFKGRASRKEYWLFILANFIVALGLGVLEGFIGIAPESEDSILASIYQLFIILPTLAVGVRRMHDANESGWALIIPIFNLIVTLRKGNPKTNKYGPAPED